MKVVVLGWDALDVELIEEYGLSGQFGMHQTKIETYVNPHIGDPHTKELWPSMLTGLHPDEHGIHAATEGDGVNWDSKTLRVAASLANGIVPGDWLTYIGNLLRRRGVGLEVTDTSYYTENNIRTVFDHVDGQPISIPNYQTENDKQHEFDAHRDNMWKELQVDWNVKKGMKPQVDLPAVHGILGKEVGRRVGHTIEAIQRGEPLVWTWFGLIDTVGHMAPALGEEIVRDYYITAAQVTQTIKELTDDDTVVISVSDHGLQNGTHEHYAILCSDAPGPCKVIDHVFDVADWLLSVDYAAKARVESLDAADIEDVNEQLEDLGYV